MEINRRTITLLLVSMLALAAGGCGSRPQQNAPASVPGGKRFNVGVLLPPEDEPTTRALQQAMQAAATANGITLTVQYRTDTSSAQPGQALLSGKPDAVILFSSGNMDTDAVVKAANTAHIPAFTVANRAHSGQVVAHVTSNLEQGGKLAAQRLADLLHEKGGVMILAGDFVPNATQAFREEMSHHPGIHILAETPFATKADKSEADIRTALSQFGHNLTGIFALSDPAGNHALELCTAQERKEVVIVGFLGSEGAKDAIKQDTDPLWKTEIASSTAGLGKTAVEQAAAFLHGQKVPSVSAVAMEAIDSSNVDPWAPPNWTTGFD